MTHIKTKRCVCCGQWKPLSAYHKDKYRKDGLYCYCKLCSKRKSQTYRQGLNSKQKSIKRAQKYEYYLLNKEKCHIRSQQWAKKHPNRCYEYYLKRHYNINYAEYLKLFRQQQGKCAICGRKRTLKRRLDVDHCHTKNKVRGLLCRQCNTALGLIDEDIKVARKLCRYLEQK